MPYDVHADLLALRARVDELARENDELRSLLEHANARAALATSASTVTGAVDPRVGLSERELRGRRWKGRVIAAVLLALGLGVGVSAAVFVRDELFRGFQDGTEASSRHTSGTTITRVEVRPHREIIVVPPAGVIIDPPAPPIPPALRAPAPQTLH